MTQRKIQQQQPELSQLFLASVVGAATTAIAVVGGQCSEEESTTAAAAETPETPETPEIYCGLVDLQAQNSGRNSDEF